MSGTASAVLLQPADVVKTRVQQHGSRHGSLTSTLAGLARAPDPLRQLWRGTVPSVVRTGAGSALYFTALNALRERVAAVQHRSSSSSAAAAASSTLPTLSPAANLASGAVARTAAGLVLMPVTVLKVRFESDLYRYASVGAASRAILARDGVRGFFKGVGATAVRDAPYAGLYVVFYDAAKARLARLAARVHPAPPPLALAASGAAPAPAPAAPLPASTAASVNFASGVLAATLATALTNPFDAIKTRLQLMPDRYANLVQAGRRIVADEGVRALLDGLAIRVARKGLSSALAWTFYEEVLRRVDMWGT